MKVIEQIRDVFALELGFPKEDFSEDLKYGETREWDSASHMVVVLALEERFGIYFEGDEVVALSSIGAIEQMLRDKGVVDQ